MESTLHPTLYGLPCMMACHGYACDISRSKPWMIVIGKRDCMERRGALLHSQPVGSDMTVTSGSGTYLLPVTDAFGWVDVKNLQEMKWR